MGTVTKRLLATVATASTILGMSALPAIAAEDNPTSSNNTVNISDVNATDETRALFAKLRDSKAGDLRFGQQHATDEHISSTASEGDVYEMTGKYPAVFGWDAGSRCEARRNQAPAATSRPMPRHWPRTSSTQMPRAPS